MFIETVTLCMKQLQSFFQEMVVQEMVVTFNLIFYFKLNINHHHRNITNKFYKCHFYRLWNELCDKNKCKFLIYFNYFIFWGLTFSFYMSLLTDLHFRNIYPLPIKFYWLYSTSAFSSLPSFRFCWQEKYYWKPMKKSANCFRLQTKKDKKYTYFTIFTYKCCSHWKHR